MKVKFEDLTIKQIHNICKGEGPICKESCPLCYMGYCLVDENPEEFYLEVEIELQAEQQEKM